MLYRRYDIPFGPGAHLALAFSATFLISFKAGGLLLNAVVCLPSSTRARILMRLSFSDCEYVSMRCCSSKSLLVVSVPNFGCSNSTLANRKGFSQKQSCVFSHLHFFPHIFCITKSIMFSSRFSVYTGLDAQYQWQFLVVSVSYYSKSWCSPSSAIAWGGFFSFVFFLFLFFFLPQGCSCRLHTLHLHMWLVCVPKYFSLSRHQVLQQVVCLAPPIDFRH